MNWIEVSVYPEQIVARSKKAVKIKLPCEDYSFWISKKLLTEYYLGICIMVLGSDFKITLRKEAKRDGVWEVLDTKKVSAEYIVEALSKEQPLTHVPEELAPEPCEALEELIDYD